MLEKNPQMVVVTDMKMPQMTGAQLLFEVKRRYPTMMRIVLSGYYEQEGVYRSVGPAHAYLMKPCTGESMIIAIERAIKLGAMLTSQSLNNFVASLSHPPKPPAIDFAIAHELESQNANTESIIGILESAGVTGALVSEFLASSFRESGKKAVDLRSVGLDQIRALILRDALFEQYADSLNNIDVLRKWNRNIARCAEAVMASETSDNNILSETFCAGILSAIGITIMAGNHPEKYAAVQKVVEETGLALAQAETEAFGIAHGVLGAHYLHQWGFVNSVVEACAYHHVPVERIGTILSTTTIIHVAEALQTDEHGLRFDGDPEKRIDQDYLQAIGVDKRLAEWQEIVKQNRV